jgi:two-component system, sensor histidine kinase and response regulator
MPGMDGFEATAYLRAIQDRIGNRCPIVALTASAMASDRKRCLEAGLDDHLAKPIRVEDLATMIDNIVADEVASPGAQARQWCQDSEEIRRAFPMSDTEMQEIVRLFRETCVKQIALMSRAIVEENPTNLSQAAHGLMGCLGMFGTKRTIALLADLERAGRNGDLDGTETMLSKLQGAIAGMQPTLNLLTETPKAEIAVCSVCH